MKALTAIKKIVLTSLFFVFIFSCKTTTEEVITYLPGYWEIESVLLPDGTKKNYSINETIDFIEINDSLKGYRKKVKPIFNGTYVTSKAIEKFQLKIENDSLNIYYKTKFDHWKETILKISKTQLKIVNRNNTIYQYKRYIPLNIDTL